MIRKLRSARLVGVMRDDSGVAGVLLVSLIAIIAFSALSVFLNKYIGDRSFERSKGTASSQGLVLGSVLAYYYQQTPTHTLPCPDTSVTPDGVADTCAGPGTTTGVLPWVTLGMSKDAAIDPFGNFYTYIVSAVGKNVCSTITSDLTGAATTTTTYTGSLIDPTDLALVEKSGATRNVAFAIISHGANGLGATSQSGTTKSAPTGSREVANAASAPSTIYAGPYSTDSSSYFDDQVFAPSDGELQKACESLTPGGQLNADMSENFDSGTGTLGTAKFGTTGSTSAPTVATDARSAGNKVASFTNGTSYLYTADAYNFNPVVRSVYASALWTPNPTSAGGVTQAGFSLATRATLADLTASNDLFGAGSGITFRFDSRTANSISSGTGAANTISIHDGSTSHVDSTATYRLITATTYRLEIYDNGSDLWMRITQVSDPTNSVTLRTTSTNDLSGTQNRIFAINGAAASYLDDLVVGLPMLALESGVTDGTATNGLTATAAVANGTSTGNLTLEAWIRPKVLPSGSNLATIVSQWDTNAGASDSDQSFRLYLDSGNNDQLALDIGGTISAVPDTEHIDLGYKPNVDEWAHVAVSFDSATQVVSFYINGGLSLAIHSGTDSGTGVRAAVERFSVGASLDSGATITNPFNGDISDVRVWNTVRTADQISDNFQVRLAATGSVTGLVVNWKLDRESGGLGSTTASASPSTIGTGGTLSGSATYVPTLALYFRPFSTSLCPAGTIVGPYQCDFRTIATAGSTQSVTIPNNLTAVYAKVWGGGGGGYSASPDSSAGGSGGFSQGLIQSIQSAGITAISGTTLHVHVGGYGTGSSTAKAGGGGGGGSGLFNSLDTFPAIIAGGGGGASFSDFNVVTGGTCTTLVGTSTQCGLGSHGGGVGAVTSRAADASSNCGGRGGDNSPTAAGSPPINGTSDCDDGGDPPSNRLGGPTSGSTGGLGGGPAGIMAGGRGYHADDADLSSPANAIGGGGGGGGAIGGEAGGYDDGGNAKGFGGGGGSGTADAGVTSTSGAVGSFSVTAAVVNDNTRQGSWADTSKTVTITTGNLLNSPVISAGCTVQSTKIGPSNNNTVQSVDSSTSLTLVNFTTGARSTQTIQFDCTGSISATAGGSTDPYYSPSYVGSSYGNPGAGGSTSSVNGHGGAVVLIW